MQNRWNRIRQGDARDLLAELDNDSVDLSLWSPPYHVGKEYEQTTTLQEWQDLLRQVIIEHGRVLRPGAFSVVNIGDIRTFRDETITRHRATVPTRGGVTAACVAKVRLERPEFNNSQIGHVLGCSEQTVERRLLGNARRGGGPRHATTRVLNSGDKLIEYAAEGGLYLYDHRVWVKSPAWQNNPWHPKSYRAVDEWENLYWLCRPGPIRIERQRLTDREWTDWGSRGIWNIPSVQNNDGPEPAFPIELAVRTIRLLTDAGNLVLDPFIGSGTTAVAAQALHRRWLGFDSCPGAVRRARRRIRKEEDGGRGLFQ